MCRVVDIRVCQSACGSRCAWGGIGCATCLRYAAGGGATDHCGVISTGNGDGDHLAGSAVCTGNSDAVGVVLSCHEFVMRGVHGVGPYAIAAYREFAVAVVAVNVGLRNQGLCAVYVSDRQGAAGALGDVAFGQAGRCSAGDDGVIVGTGNRY